MDGKESGGGGGGDVTKLVFICRRHKCMTPTAICQLREVADIIQLLYLKKTTDRCFFLVKMLNR